MGALRGDGEEGGGLQAEVLRGLPGEFFPNCSLTPSPQTQVGDGVRLEGFQSPLEEQQEVLEQLDKKHRQKEELHGRINRKKLLMASRGASRSPSPLELEDS